MEILSTREIALVIWFVLIFGWAVWKAKAWALLGGMVRTFCKPIILRSIAVMGTYVAASTWLLSKVHLWELDNLKTTVTWFVTFALGWMFDMKRWDTDPNEGARSTLKEILSVTVFVTFLADFYTTHLLIELVIVPVVTFVAVIGTFSQERPGLERVSKVFGALLSICGFALLGYAAYRLLGDLRGFATPETGREFAVPGLLSLLFIPFMYVFNVYAAYDMSFRTLPRRLEERGVKRYAFKRAVLSFGLDVKLMRRWKAALFQRGATTRADVDALITAMKEAKRRELEPPTVGPEEGWSPYLAIEWLTGNGLPTSGYNPIYGGEWGASSPYRRLEGGVLGDSLAYYVRGNERAVTKLILMLNRDRLAKETPKPSLEAFSEALLALLNGAFGEKAARAARGLKNRKHRTTEGFASLALKDADSTIELTITHKAHVERY